MTRRISCLLLILTLIALSFSSVFAKECRFSLLDASVKKGRLFEINLSADSKEKIASFVAEITFDSRYLKFKSCETSDENAVIEVNQIDEGKLRIVYLCKDGTDYSVFNLTFKALQEGSTEVTCDISQVINTDYEDIVVTSCKSAKISIYASHKDATDKMDVSQKTTDNASMSYDESEVTTVEGKSSTKTEIMIFSVLTILCLVSAVGFISYKLGKKELGKKEDNEK